MSKGLRLLAACLLSLASLAFGAPAPAKPVYRIEAVPALVGIYDINDGGAVSGSSGGRAAVVRANGVVRLHARTEGDTAGNAINDNGVVAVTVYVGSSGRRAQIWFPSAAQVRDLGTLGGAYTDAQDINIRAQVVGTSTLADGLSRGYVSDGFRMRDLGTLGGAQSEAHGINDAGQIVGTSQLANGLTRAFIEHEGVMRDLGHLGGGLSEGHAINARGHATGWSLVDIGRLDHEHAFIWDGRRMRDLGTLGGKFSYGHAINRHDEVVGVSRFVDEGDPNHHAFLFTAGVMYSLMDLLDDSGTGWSRLFSAGAINNSGDIVGQGMFNGGLMWYVARRVSD